MGFFSIFSRLLKQILGDTVTIAKRHEDFDWSGCPERSSGRLKFSPSSWTITVRRLEGQWFYPAEFENLIAPLAALGTVNLAGKAHSISEVQAPKARPTNSKGKAKIMGGYEEEWCPGQNVERFKCALVF